MEAVWDWHHDNIRMEQLLSIVVGLTYDDLVIITTLCDIMSCEHGWLWFVWGFVGLLSWNEQGVNNYDMCNEVLEVSQLENVKIVRKSENHKRSRSLIATPTIVLYRAWTNNLGAWCGLIKTTAFYKIFARLLREKALQLSNWKTPLARPDCSLLLLVKNSKL